ncbi:hypothetical protein RMATCC62417_18710 [Rhizopus microsporus]|nr:hypothetical protein RMATCC62417_18710 [Rhizopus microsporus]
MNMLNIDFPHAIMDEDCIPRRADKNKSDVFKKLFGEKGIIKKEKSSKCKTIVYDALDLFIRISKIYKNEDTRNFVIYDILNNNFKNNCRKIYLVFDKEKEKDYKNKYIIKRKEYEKIKEDKKVINYENYINGFINFLKKVKNKHINFNVTFVGLINKIVIILQNTSKEKLILNNHIEADTNIWSTINSLSEKEVLIKCNDKDIIMIGLLLYDKLIYKNIKIIIETKHKEENKDIYENYYINNINNNIKSIFKNKIKYPIINILIIYVLSGCDYVSSIYKIGKESFIKTYIESFDNIGDLVYNYNYNIINLNIDSCLKLIGLCYLNKYIAKGYDYFNNDLINKKGKEVVKYLRQTMIKNINKKNNDEEYIKMLIPDEKSLYFHILRTKYVINIWNQSLKNQINYFNPKEYGWVKNDNDIYIPKYKK